MLDQSTQGLMLDQSTQGLMLDQSVQGLFMLKNNHTMQREHQRGTYAHAHAYIDTGAYTQTHAQDASSPGQQHRCMSSAARTQLARECRTASELPRENASSSSSSTAFGSGNIPPKPTSVLGYGQLFRRSQPGIMPSMWRRNLVVLM
jgi:hypothetical protein